MDRPFNYRKAFTQTDNIRPTTRQLNMKTLQNLTYQDWARKGVRPKEMYHWTINGIKHTTHKYWNGKFNLATSGLLPVILETSD